MEARAKLMYMPSSARKVRLLADLVRRKPVDAVLAMLVSLKNRKKSVEFVEKTLKSAIANLAEKNPQLDTEKLVIKEIFVDAGPAAKRIRARAQGRAMRRLKRTSHLTVVVSDLSKGEE